MSLFDTERLVVRNWGDADRAAFHRLNSDPVVMEFFPFRRDRAQSDDLLDTLRVKIGNEGHGFMALERKDTGACIGFAGIQRAGLEPLLPAETTEIGWRLLPEAWGAGYASEAALGWLEFGFGHLELPEIVAFAVWNNHRSTAVMRRIDMRHDPDATFEHPRVPDDQPSLKRHVLYRIDRARWAGAVNPSAR